MNDAKGIRTEIMGSLQADEEVSILLEEMGAREYIPVDTVFSDESGEFLLEFFPEKIAFYVLRFGQTAYTTLLIEPGEKISFSADYTDPVSYSLTGSPGSELLRQLSIEHKRSLDALGEIGRMNRENMSSPDYTRIKFELDSQFDSITSDFQDYSLRFIQEHSDSPAILIALYNLYGQGLPVFDSQANLDVYQFVDSVLTISHGDLEAVQLLHAQVTEAEQLLNSEPSVPGIQKGDIAPDFVSSRPDGSDLALSDLKGNYVLLGFWAGWSSLSREENTTLLRARERYEGKNFKILQVSVDDDRDTWIQAIAKDELDWEHVSDLKRWESPVVNIYRVEKIPFSVIIDPNGRVVATDLYGEKLMSTLDNLLNN
jgi:peroxiredoxin